MATLSFKNINKIYSNNVQAVFDFNLDIKDKEFIVFVGPSGCGKSTTLRMVAGLEEISSGQLYIDDVLVNDIIPSERNIAMVFQNYALYPHFSVYNNMAFSLKLRKFKKPVVVKGKDTDRLIKECNKIRTKIARIDRVFKRKQNADNLLLKRENLLHDLYKIEEKLEASYKQLKGIDEKEIIKNQKEILKLSKELLEIDSAIKYADAMLADSEVSKEKKEEIEKAKVVVLLQKENKTHNLNDLTKRVDFLSKNKVPLFEYRKLTSRELFLQVNKAAESLDLIRYLYRKPAALSGGQRQRVALGRAIVRNPKVFLMDEPLSNLDAKLRVQTRSEIIKIHKRVGATTIYVTHDQTEAMTMASRIVVMSQGYIQQIGTPDEVYNNPDNMFVAGFIGSPSMNFLQGVYSKRFLSIRRELTDAEKAEGKKTSDFEITKFKVNKEQEKLLSKFEGKEIVLGIRPENISLSGDTKISNKSQVIKAVCDFAELLGDELILNCYLSGFKLVAKCSSRKKVKNEENVSLNFDMDKLYFFDAETKKRIR